MIKKAQKYNNKKVINKFGIFDSQKEFTRFLWLKNEQELGHIKEFERQVTFELLPNQYEESQEILKSGKIKKTQKLIERKLEYVADFVYIDCLTNEKIIEDVKGYITEIFKIKKKLMYYIYKIKIKIIK